MKSGLGKMFFSSSGFIVRRCRNAFMVSVFSMFFVFIHYFMKDHWTERFMYHHGEGENYAKFDTKTVMPGRDIERRNQISSAPSISITTNLIISSFSPYQDDHAIPSKPKYNQESVPNDLWLNEFTHDLPYKLANILQNILTRDFEKKNTTLQRNRSIATRCQKGFFRLRGMAQCQKWLGCSEINSLERGTTFGSGVGKLVQLSKWNGMDVVISSLRSDRSKYKMFIERVLSGVRHMLMVQPSPYATQIVGVCDDGISTVLVLENCWKGNFANFYLSPDFKRLSTKAKFKFAIQMIASFDYLHRGLSLPRVHCDLHTVRQAFGQWVVSEDHRLFLSDLDELPVVDKKKKIYATCQREPFGKMEMENFLAPEARYSPMEFEKELPLKSVDEYSDVWKFPDLFANIMNKSPDKTHLETTDTLDISYYFQKELKDIHRRCKHRVPSKRPSSREVLTEYLELFATEFP